VLSAGAGPQSSVPTDGVAEGDRYGPQDRAQDRETEGDGSGEGDEDRGPEHVFHVRVIGRNGLAGTEPERVIFEVVRSNYAFRRGPSDREGCYSGAAARYPTLRTVSIRCSCSGPSFARSRRT